MRTNPENQAEQRLLLELEDIQKRIASLEAERASLERLLVKLRRENLTKHEVTRSNSIDRIMVEKQTLEFLEKFDRPVPTAKIYNYVRITIPELKENTYRSHLHRMKKRGLINSPKGRRGIWELPQRPDTES